MKEREQKGGNNIQLSVQEQQQHAMDAMRPSQDEGRVSYIREKMIKTKAVSYVVVGIEGANGVLVDTRN